MTDTNNFNSNTGAPLTTGQSYVNSAGNAVTQGTSYTPTQNTPTTITSANTAPTASITPVSAHTDTTDYAALIGGTADNVNKLTSDYNTKLSANTDTTDTNSTASQILRLMGQDANKATDTATANESTGLNTATKQLNDLNAQMQNLNLSAQAIPIQTQQNNANTGATDAGVAPQTAGALRENALKALSLSQQANVATANYNTAQAQVKQMIDLKYAPIEAHLQTLQTQYSLNKDVLDSIDKKRSDALSLYLTDQQNKIATQKATDTAIQNIALEAAKSGRATPDIMSAISSAKTVNDAIKAGGTALATASTDVVKLDNGNTLLIDKNTGKVIKNFGGSGSTASNITLGSTVVRTIPTTGGQTPVTGYTLQKGDDPYQIALANGTDMNTLKQLNPNISDWSTLQPGAVINLPDASNNWLKGKSDTQVQAYNSLPAEDKSSIQQLVTGSALLTDLVKSRGLDGTKAINKLITEAKSVDPTFTVNGNKLRYNYQQQFNNPNGKEQTQINAINTGLGHLAEFNTAAQALGNTKFTDINSLNNYISKHTGDSTVTNFKTVTTALASELATIYKGGTAPSEKEIADWENNILANYSSNQLSGVASTTANLISNKILSMNNTYKNVMGTYPTNSIINPDVIQQLNDSGVDISGITDKLKTQGYDTPQQSPTIQLKTWATQSPQNTTAVANAVAKFPQYTPDEILQVLGVNQ